MYIIAVRRAKHKKHFAGLRTDRVSPLRFRGFSFCRRVITGAVIKILNSSAISYSGFTGALSHTKGRLNREGEEGWEGVNYVISLCRRTVACVCYKSKHSFNASLNDFAIRHTARTYIHVTGNGVR